MQNGSPRELKSSIGPHMSELVMSSSPSDVFEQDFEDDDNGTEGNDKVDNQVAQLPLGFDELPIELISLSDRLERS